MCFHDDHHTTATLPFRRGQSVYAQISDFFEANGQPKLIFLYQIPDTLTDDGELESAGTSPQLMLTSGESVRMKAAAMYAIRISTKGVGMKTMEQDVSTGVLEGTADFEMGAASVERYSATCQVPRLALPQGA